MPKGNSLPYAIISVLIFFKGSKIDYFAEKKNSFEKKPAFY